MQLVDIITWGTVLVAAIVAIASIASSFYIAWVYRQRKEESAFLTHLVNRDIRVSLASAWILGYIAVALAGYSLARPWGALAIGIPVVVMMIGPISDAWLWRSERRRR